MGKKSPRRDPWWLLLVVVAWIPAAGWRPDEGTAALLGLGSGLFLCKVLAMSPAWRACIAPLPAFAMSLSLGVAAHAALAGALLAAGGYLGFTLARHGAYAVHRWRFRTPEGIADGWDYGQWLIARERLFAWLPPWRRRRILFLPTEMEADLRKGFAHRGDRLRFAHPSHGELHAHDLVVPLTLPDLDVLRGFDALLARNPLPLPHPRCVDLCNDKLDCNRALVAAGFADCVPEIGDSLPFPYVLKKRIDAWGDNTHVVANAGDERRLAALMHDPGYFRQAFVPGQREYAAHLLVRNRRIVAALAVEYVFVQDLHKKSREQPPHYRRLRRATHLPLFRDMLAAIGYEGLCCVNYKLQEGRVRLLEINPRFGASLAPWFFAMVRALPRAERVTRRATTSAANPTGA